MVKIFPFSNTGTVIALEPSSLGRRMFLFRAESAKVILHNELGKFTKKYVRSIAELVGDQSLLCASLQQHKMIRGRLTNLFSTTSISMFIKMVDELMVETSSGWEHGSTLVILDEALKVFDTPKEKKKIAVKG